MRTMSIRRRWTGLLAMASTLAAVAAPSSDRLSVLLSQAQIRTSALDQLYRDAIERDVGTDKVIGELKAHAQNSGNSKRHRANAWLLASRLQWREGQLKPARDSIEQALKIQTTAELALQQARLLEAAGELQKAQSAYTQALDLAADPALKEQIRLRMTFVTLGQNDDVALVELAQRGDRAFRNRAAVALAVLGHYAEAASLYEVYGDGNERFRQHLRLAQWALEAGAASKAQEQAWSAVQTASLDADRRYALGVLVDAHELDASFDRLLERFGRSEKLSQAEQETRTALLQKLGRYDEAIGLLRQADNGRITPASRRQLLRMYSDAGHSADMVAEYRKLIASQPAQIAWPEGLSQYLMEQGDRTGAQEAWAAFIERNDDAGVLLSAAAAIDRLGFEALAVAATQKCMTVDPHSAGAAFLFRFELYRRRGAIAEAQKTLSELEAVLAADGPERIQLADAYERIEKPLEALRVLKELDRSRAGGLDVDERMRMAWLYENTGQTQEAFAAWKALWNGQTRNAARRLVEDRLLNLAGRTGSLADMAVELETKLANGTADKKDSGLLIRIYTATQDPASAVEVIREYFRSSGRDGKTEVESLREQAQVYRTLHRYKAFERTTTRLIELDPDGKVDYLQSLVLNRLENAADESAEKQELLQRWLAELRKTGGAAAGPEFEAGILLLAGKEEDAIATYRRALAENPAHSDNYLLLTDLLRKRGREAEAIAILQYAVETSQQDADFIVGIDGILNLRPKDKWVIQWAQRRVFERLTLHDDKLYLYDLLGELAEASGDASMYFSALENSLAYANTRRSNVLRELIAASAAKTPGAMMSAGISQPDPRRNLRYSRRLISLGEALPPEVYTDMGKVFLKMGDPDNAAHAFNRAIDETGEASLIEETGDLFRDEGYNRQAVTQYTKALIADADNVPVMRKLAEVRTRQGALQDANELQMKALLGLVQSLPLQTAKTAQRGGPGAAGRPPSLEDTAGFMYKNNYWWLLAGFLYTLPPDETPFFAIEQAFGQALQQTLASAEGSSLKELAYYPRLNVISRFAREAALRSGRYEFADALDGRLLKHFGGDQYLLPELLEQRAAIGMPTSAVRLAAQAQGAAAQKAAALKLAIATYDPTGLQQQLPSKAAALAAVERQDYARAIDIALFVGDQPLAVSIYRDWARSIMQAPVPAPGGKFLNGLLREAKDKLDAQSHSILARHLIEWARERPAVMEELVLGASSTAFDDSSIPEPLLLDLEKSAQRTLISAAELSKLVAAKGGRSLPGIDIVFLMSRLPPEERLKFIEKYAGGGAMDGSYTLPALRATLSEPLNASQSARVMEWFKEQMRQQMGEAGRSSTVPIERRLRDARLVQTKDGTVANAGLIEEMDAFLAATFPERFHAGFFKIDLLHALGRDSEALSLIVESALHEYGAAEQKAANAQFEGEATAPETAVRLQVERYKDIIHPRYTKQAAALAQAKEQDLGLTPAVFALLWSLQTSDPDSNPLRRINWLEELTGRHPESEEVLTQLAARYGELGYVDLQLRTVERLTAQAQRNNTYRMQLFGMWWQLDHPENAVKALKGRLAGVMRGIPQAGAPLRGFDPMARQPPIRKALDQLEQEMNDGGNLEQARAALRTLLQKLPPPGASPRDFMTPEANAQTLRYETLFALSRRSVREGATAPLPGPQRQAIELWEMPQPPADDPYSRKGKLLDALVEREYSLAEFEAQIRTLRPQDIDQQYLLYTLLAEAWQKHGRLPVQLARLSGKVETAQAGRKEYLLWLEVLSRSPQADVARALPLIERATTAMGALGGYPLVALARVYARAGDQIRAADLYASAMLSAAGAAQVLGGGRLPFATAAGLYSDAAGRLSAQGLSRLAEALFRIARPPARLAGSGVYEEFIMWVLERTPDSQPALAHFQAALRGQQTMEGWDPLAMVQAADLLARAGRRDEALEILLAAMKTAALPDVGDDGVIFLTRNQMELGEYSAGLGLRRRQTDVRQPLEVEGFRRLFPISADAWPGAAQWSRQAADAIAGWVEHGTVDRNRGLQLLLLAILRQNLAGDREAALASTHKLTKLLAPYEQVPMSLATSTALVLVRVQAPLDTAMLRSWIEHKRVSPQLLAPVLKQVAATDAASALALGESALAYTQNAEVLLMMISLAAEAGRTDLVQLCAKLQQNSEQAREALVRADSAQAAATPGKAP